MHRYRQRIPSRICLLKIGPYVNENAFDFDVSDITKRMVLIGGKNGAGTSREEFLDAFNVAMQFYEKKDS